MKHLLRVKEEYFFQLRNGTKKLEIRVGYNSIRKIKPGDTISFENYSKNEFDVKRVTRYDSFDKMLSDESVEKVLPGCSFSEALSILRGIYPRSKEALGVYVFELYPKTALKSKRIITFASHYLKDNRKIFTRIIADSYKLTDWICADYPEHFNHFWTKYVPGIIVGKREIISYYVDNEIAGTIILKNDEERKICTFFVSDKFHNQKIGTALLEQAFKYLGTTKPLITISDYKAKMFEGIIRKYDWQLIQSIDGIYNNHSKELIYNGRL